MRLQPFLQFSWLTSLSTSLSCYVRFCFDLLRASRRGVSWKLFLIQVEFVGVRSLAIICLAAVMVGAVFGIQFGSVLEIFGVQSLIGAASSYALARELAPVLSSFLVAGRAGSAMTAELAMMRITDQMDALTVMGQAPLRVLALPRVAACLITVPLLSLLFLLIGVSSAYGVGVVLFGIDTGIFLEKMKWITGPRHIFEGLQKSVFFAFLIGTICCYHGFHASGGAREVGTATTAAVVRSLVSILLLDFCLSFLQLERGMP